MGCNWNDASWWKSRKISRWDANNILMKSLFTSESMLTSQDRAVKISITKFIDQICILNCKYISHQRARWPTELQQWKECDLTGQLSYSIFWQVLDILISLKLKVLTNTIPQGKTHFNSQFSKFSKHSLNYRRSPQLIDSFYRPNLNWFIFRRHKDLKLLLNLLAETSGMFGTS